MQYNLKEIAQLNIARGLVSDTSNPDKFIYFIKKSNLIDIYDEHPILLNSHENWLFYIMKNITNVKNWVKKTLPLIPNNDINRINCDGNNIFLEAVKSNHLKTALLLVDKGADFNHINNDGQSFVSFVQQNFRKEKYKRGYFKILIFISKFIDNNFKKSISLEVSKQILVFLDEVKYILNFHYEKSATAYSQYWDNIINLNKKLLISAQYLKEEAFKKTLEQTLPTKHKSNIIVKI